MRRRLSLALAVSLLGAGVVLAGAAALRERPSGASAPPAASFQTEASARAPRIEGVHYVASRDGRLEVGLAAASIRTAPRRVGPVHVCPLRVLLLEDLRLRLAVRDEPSAPTSAGSRRPDPVSETGEALELLRELLPLGAVTRVRAAPVALRFEGPEGLRLAISAGEARSAPDAARLELAGGLRIETATAQRLEGSAATWWRRGGRLDLRGPWRLREEGRMRRGADGLFALDLERGRLRLAKDPQRRRDRRATRAMPSRAAPAASP